jgi:hypothetical protein
LQPVDVQEGEATVGPFHRFGDAELNWWAAGCSRDDNDVTGRHSESAKSARLHYSALVTRRVCGACRDRRHQSLAEAAQCTEPGGR